LKLRVFLPDTARPDAATRFAWRLFDSRGQTLREDSSPAAEIPRADDVEAVLPAGRVLFARLKLPKVNAATIRELLPYAVEDRLLADPSHIHAVAGARNARGETVVAVVDRDWLQGMLDVLARAGLRPSRAWCESALLAGMIQQPSALNPYRHQGKRAIARRNVVLGAMVETGAIIMSTDTYLRMTQYAKEEDRARIDADLTTPPGILDTDEDTVDPEDSGWEVFRQEVAGIGLGRA